MEKLHTVVLLSVSVKSAWGDATELHQYLRKKKLQELLLLGLFLVRNVMNIVLPL